MNQAPKRLHSQVLNTDNCFTAETSSYRIKVSFIDSKLTVTLQDLVNFIVYSKTYEEDDKSGSIHKRVGLEDIFHSLTQSDQHKFDQVYTCYNFGDIVQQKGVPCFKIQEKGKVTVYVCLLDRRSQKQLNYQSILTLDKVRDMTELESVRQQLIMEKKKNSTMIAKLQKTQQLQKSLKLAKQHIQRMTNSMKQLKFGKKNSNGYLQSIYYKVIPFDEVYTFQLKIIKAPQRNVYIGIVDYEKQSMIQCFRNSEIAVGYHWQKQNQGHKYPGAVIESIGFKQGQTVEVKVDLSHKLITWFVDGIKRATHTHNIMGEKSRKFVPFIEVYYENTCFRWL